MATAEAETSRDERASAGGSVYDGFISYSHDADDLLAPRLQAGLQRFAKPWWKRRALHIFRDETSLSASPHLWGSVTEAMDQSEWLILLLSPQAAQSSWVDQEVEYWLEHGSADRILPVVTDGEFRWADGDVTPATDAAPPALYGAFGGDPRWVDLRFARTDEHLDLNNPSFRAAIADVASAIHGVPKDELESEEVRQQRHTIRSAWAAGIALLTLTILAGGAAFYANGQRQEAVQNEERAFGFSAQLLDFAIQREVTVTPGDYFIGDQGPSGNRYQQAAPDSTRLDFLQESCNPTSPSAVLAIIACTRDAQFVHPVEPIRVAPWNAYAPFHIRHGFVGSDPDAESAPVYASVDRQIWWVEEPVVFLYVRRDTGPVLGPSEWRIGEWHRFLPDYVVRETTDRCGPGYRQQTEAVTCDLFVHDFPEGLPPGRYTFFLEWRAPCSDWFQASVCDHPTAVVSLFNSQVESPFLHEDFQEEGIAWPRELWDDAQPIP